jgi:hypothetical protein
VLVDSGGSPFESFCHPYVLPLSSTWPWVKDPDRRLESSMGGTDEHDPSQDSELAVLT